MKEFDLIDMNIKFYTQMIKQNRKSVYAFIGVIVISILAAITNLFIDNLFSRMAFGVTVMNSIWFAFFLIDALQDLKHNKELLHRYKEHDSYKDRQESIDSYNLAKRYYEDNLKSLTTPDFAEVE